MLEVDLFQNFQLFSGYMRMSTFIIDALFKLLLFYFITLELVLEINDTTLHWLCFRGRFSITISLLSPTFQHLKLLLNARYMRIWEHHLCTPAPTHSVKVLERSFKQGVMFTIPLYCSL